MKKSISILIASALIATPVAGKEIETKSKTRNSNSRTYKIKTDTPVVTSISSNGTLARHELLLIMKERLSNPDTDPFTGERTKRYSGRNFEVVLPIPSEEASGLVGANAVWSFDRTTQALTYSLLPITSMDLSIEFFSTETPAGVFTGTNGFGTKFKVKRTNILIGTLVDKKGDLDLRGRSYSVTLSPEKAKLTSNSIVLRASGIINEDNGVVTSCSNSIHQATMDYPVQANLTSCAISVKFLKFDLVDVRDGSILHEWVPKQPAPPKSREWIRPPTLSDSPYLNDMEKVSGEAIKVVVACIANEIGKLEDCKITSESSPGHILGEAALLSARRARLSPGTGPFTITIPFLFPPH